MVVKELNAGALLLFSLIMLGVAFNLLTARNYGKSNQAVARLLSEDRLVSYMELSEICREGSQAGYLIVDLRPEDEYRAGHLPGAVNIQWDQILDRRHKKLIDGQRPVFLYADREHKSMAARVLLLGQGIEGVRVIAGNYATIKAWALDSLEPSKSFYHEDKARFDFPRYMRAAPAGSQQTAPDTPLVPGADAVTPLPGGC